MTAARASWIFSIALAACVSPTAPRAIPRDTNPPLRAEPTTEPPTPEPPAPAPPGGDDRSAVAAENASAVEAARAVLASGGSAGDAAVAGVLVGCAAHPSSCGLGGGGAAMVYDATSGRPSFLDFRETAPTGIKPAEHIARAVPAERRGIWVGVPGLVAGLAALHERTGKLPWEMVVGAAADFIERGLPVSPYAKQVIAWSSAWMKDDPRAPLLGLPSDADREGAVVKNPALVATLRTLAKGGRAAFYSGALTDDVVDTAREKKSRITRRDLAGYQAEWREPIRIPWEDTEVVTAAPSSGGGFTIATALGMFDRKDVRALEAGSGAFVHAVAEGIRASYADRATSIGDPDFIKMDMRSLLDRDRLKARRAKIDMKATTLPRIPSIAESGTFQIVVVDGAGNVVSLTASLTSMFGSKLVTRGGYALDDALTDFTLDDYGKRLVSKGPNVVHGGARPVASAVPTIVLKGGKPILALGGSGGLRATTGVLEVLLGRLAFDRPITEAVAAPRFHVASSGALKLESALSSLGPDLLARGEIVSDAGPAFAAVTAIEIGTEDGKRRLLPAFDPRKGGAVTVERASPSDRGTGVTKGGPGP